MPSTVEATEQRPSNPTQHHEQNQPNMPLDLIQAEVATHLNRIILSLAKTKALLTIAGETALARDVDKAWNLIAVKFDIARIPDNDFSSVYAQTLHNEASLPTIPRWQTADGYGIAAAEARSGLALNLAKGPYLVLGEDILRPYEELYHEIFGAFDVSVSWQRRQELLEGFILGVLVQGLERDPQTTAQHVAWAGYWRLRGRKGQAEVHDAKA